MTDPAHDDLFESQRGRLFGLAYRMLGARAEAEDIVQETYVRWHQADRSAIHNAEAWLVTTATRLAIDRLRILKVEREAYVGPWLPEPIAGESESPDHAVEVASDLSIAFLVLLERLAPEERAAFLLHDVFERDYSEIANILDKSESACRQITHRARERVRTQHKRFAATEEAKSRLLRQFLAAVDARDDKTLMGLFAADAVWTADGGGKTAAGPRPIVGVERIVHLVLGLQALFQRQNGTFHAAVVNGEPGLCIRTNGQLTGFLAIDDDGEQIHNVYVVLNPDKLEKSRI